MARRKTALKALPANAHPLGIGEAEDQLYVIRSEAQACLREDDTESYKGFRSHGPVEIRGMCPHGVDTIYQLYFTYLPSRGGVTVEQQRLMNFAKVLAMRLVSPDAYARDLANYLCIGQAQFDNGELLALGGINSEAAAIHIRGYTCCKPCSKHMNGNTLIRIHNAARWTESDLNRELERAWTTQQQTKLQYED